MSECQTRPLKPQLFFAVLWARLEAAPFAKPWWSEFFSSLPDSCLAAVNISTPKYFNPV
jgi:hypothetical protein